MYNLVEITPSRLVVMKKPIVLLIAALVNDLHFIGFNWRKQNSTDSLVGNSQFSHLPDRGAGGGSITFVRKFEEGMDNETAAAADALTIMWIASNVVT